MLSGILVGREFQNLRIHVVVLEIAAHIFKTSGWTSSTEVSVDNFSP